jgi:hypothetical protein
MLIVADESKDLELLKRQALLNGLRWKLVSARFVPG